jgi:hypothetical protein
MNSKGEVRSASEFKDIFEDVGESYAPYRCPFCEVLYEDRCIVTECVKAPHFKLPNGTSHVGECNGETVGESSTVVTSPSKSPKRTVVGGIELPEALVKRRKALTLHKPSEEGRVAPPDAREVDRRRKLVASDKTISSHYTTSQLRALVHAYKRLRKFAHDQAVGAQLAPKSAAYNDSFGKTLEAYPLSLYGQKLTYRWAFQGSKLQPWNAGRIYFGSGKVFVEGDQFVITDSDSWPKSRENKLDLVPFVVKIGRTLALDAPTSHAYALEELGRLAAAAQVVSWHAYGVPALQGERYELILDALDDVYWVGQHQR